MTCMTTKQKFDVDDPTVVVLSNGRYAYRVECPWEGKNGKRLFAFKFCGLDAYERHLKRSVDVDEQEGGVDEEVERSDKQVDDLSTSMSKMAA